MGPQSEIDGLPDDAILALPEANVRPGDLSRLWSLRAGRLTEKEFQQQEDRRVALHAHDEQERKHEQEQRDIKRREAELLRQLDERERQIERALKDIDDRAIKLADGRRAYVDGDTYRDAQGRELTGADRAEAEQLHLENPRAATWQEKTRLDEKLERVKAARQNVEKLQSGPDTADEETKLTSYERDFRASMVQDKAEFGTSAPAKAFSTDYSALLNGSAEFSDKSATQETKLSADFSSAVTGSGRSEIASPSSPADTGTLKQSIGLKNS